MPDARLTYKRCDSKYLDSAIVLAAGAGIHGSNVTHVARLTRRRLLIGLGATAGAAIAAGGGFAALGDSGRQHLVHDVGLASLAGDAPSTPGVTIASGDLASVYMGRNVGWSISTPPREAHAIVYCLHGKDGDHRFAFDTVELPAVVESLQAPLIVAAVDGGSDSYWHPRADGTDALAMLLEEFIPFVERRTNITRRAVLGWSMGGYGSLLAAEQLPHRFVAVVAASPALWTSPGLTAPGAFDSPDDFHRFDVFTAEDGLAGATVRVDCGTSDPFYHAARLFVAGLPPGHQGSFGPGSHNATYWRSVAPDQIATIAHALPAP